MADAGLNVSLGDIPYALMIPVAGMVAGLILSIIVFRKPKTYETKEISGANASPYTKKAWLSRCLPLSCHSAFSSTYLRPWE